MKLALPFLMTITQAIFYRKKFQECEARAAPMIISILKQICADNKNEITELAKVTFIQNYDIVNWIISLLKLDNWLFQNVINPDHVTNVLDVL